MKKNKQVKQMIVDVVLGGRKAIWYGEESEVFAANSVEQLHEEFSFDESDDMDGGVISVDWRYWWNPCVSEKSFVSGAFVTKGSSVKDSDGNENPALECLPLICGVYGGPETPVQVTTIHI